MFSIFLLGISSASKFDDLEIGYELVSNSAYYTAGDYLKVESSYKNMLIIFRPTAEGLMGAFCMKEKGGKPYDTINVKDAQYVFFKGSYGMFEINVTKAGYFNITAVCLPDECLGRIWGANTNGAVFQLLDDTTEKYSRIENGKTYCVVFATITNPFYQITQNLSITTKTKIYYNHYNTAKRAAIDELVTSPDILAPDGYFKIKVKGSEKNRFIEIKDDTDSIDNPLADYKFGGWIDYDKSLSTWMIVLIVVGAVLLIALIVLIIYCIRNKNRLRGTGPEYSNLTELPVQPMPDTP